MLRLLACLLSGILLAGCAVSEEDRDFYYTGWVKPHDLRITGTRGKEQRNPPGGEARPDPLDQ